MRRRLLDVPLRWRHVLRVLRHRRRRGPGHPRSTRTTTTSPSSTSGRSSAATPWCCPKQHTVDLTDTPPETVAGMLTIGQRIAKAARAIRAEPTATTSSSTTARRPSRASSTSTCTCCRAQTATSCRSPRACWCAATPTGRRRAGFCATRWRRSTPAANTGRMALRLVEQTLLPYVLTRARHRSTRGPTAGSGTAYSVSPSLLLHTVGAKTGKARTRDADLRPRRRRLPDRRVQGRRPESARLVPQPEGQPERRDQRRAKAFPVTAQPVLPDDPDYKRLWQIVNKNNAHRYSAYQERNDATDPGGRADARVELEQLLGQQFQRRLAPGSRSRVGAAVRRRDRVDHHLVDVEALRQRGQLFGGLCGRADDRPVEPGVDDVPAAAGSARRRRRPRRVARDRSGCPVRSRAIMCRFGSINASASSRVGSDRGVDGHERHRFGGQVARPELRAVERQRLLGALHRRSDGRTRTAGPWPPPDAPSTSTSRAATAAARWPRPGVALRM